MLLHCDVVCVTEQARLTTPFVNLALVPEAASSLLMQARIGYARAYSLFALGEPVDGKTVVEWGWRGIWWRRRRHAKALAVAHTLAEKPIGALRATKRLMRDAALIAQTMDRECRLCRAPEKPGGRRGIPRLRREAGASFKRVAS